MQALRVHEGRSLSTSSGARAGAATLMLKSAGAPGQACGVLPHPGPNLLGTLSPTLQQCGVTCYPKKQKSTIPLGGWSQLRGQFQ